MARADPLRAYGCYCGCCGAVAGGGVAVGSSVGVEAGSRYQYGLEFPTLLGVDLSIDYRPVNKQRRRSQRQFLLAQISGARLIAGYTLAAG
jgi:hypothetical protein